MSKPTDVQDQNRGERDEAGAEDARLVGAALADAPGAFDDLVRRYQRRAVAVAYRLLGNVHDAADVARLYYGVYYRSLDPKTGKRTTPQGLIRDLELIRELATPKGQRFFLMARTVRVPTPDVGNPAWALSNLDAAYSLQVAVFEGTDDFWDFKQVAADYCAHLRKRGYEAYYHHASASSMITVGAFGEDAVRIPPTGLPYYSPEVIAMQQDEILKYNRLNGKIYRARTNTGEKVRVESRLVKIPSGDDGDRW